MNQGYTQDVAQAALVVGVRLRAPAGTREALHRLTAQVARWCAVQRDAWRGARMFVPGAWDGALDDELADLAVYVGRSWGT